MRVCRHASGVDTELGAEKQRRYPATAETPSSLG